jgi:hypothetical protein
MLKLMSVVGVALVCAVPAHAAGKRYAPRARVAAPAPVVAPAPAPVAYATYPVLSMATCPVPSTTTSPTSFQPDGAKQCRACGEAGPVQIRKTWTCTNGEWTSSARCAPSDPCNGGSAAGAAAGARVATTSGLRGGSRVRPGL